MKLASRKAISAIILSITWGLLSTRANAQATEQPTGPDLNFTLNYINNSLAQGSVVLRGHNLVWTHDFNLGSTTSQVVTAIDLLTLDMDPFPTPGYANGNGNVSTVYLSCPRQSAQVLTFCVSNSQTVTDSTNANLVGVSVSNDLNAMLLPVSLNGNVYKVRDVANALKHLIQILKAQEANSQAQHEDELKQQQQQNQSDPFATAH